MGIQEKLSIETQDMITSENSWMVQVLVIGAVVGALTGLAGAYLLVQRSKNKGVQPNLSSKEGLRLGLLVFGLLRQVAMLGDDD